MRIWLIRSFFTISSTEPNYAYIQKRTKIWRNRTELTRQVNSVKNKNLHNFFICVELFSHFFKISLCSKLPQTLESYYHFFPVLTLKILKVNSGSCAEYLMKLTEVNWFSWKIGFFVFLLIPQSLYSSIHFIGRE